MTQTKRRVESTQEQRERKRVRARERYKEKKAAQLLLIEEQLEEKQSKQQIALRALTLVLKLNGLSAIRQPKKEIWATHAEFREFLEYLRAHVLHLAMIYKKVYRSDWLLEFCGKLRVMCVDFLDRHGEQGLLCLHGIRRREPRGVDALISSSRQLLVQWQHKKCFSWSEARLASEEIMRMRETLKILRDSFRGNDYISFPLIARLAGSPDTVPAARPSVIHYLCERMPESKKITRSMTCGRNSVADGLLLTESAFSDLEDSSDDDWEEDSEWCRTFTFKRLREVAF